MCRTYNIFVKGCLEINIPGLTQGQVKFTNWLETDLVLIVGKTSKGIFSIRYSTIRNLSKN